MPRTLPPLLAALALSLLAACADDDAGSGDPGGAGLDGSRNVVQSGAQDFARFRRIVEEGGVPAQDTLDAVGFFAEHALDLPPAECGLDVCAHPMLAVAPRFDGSNWTMAFVALGTPVDPAALERPPVHVVLAVEATRAYDEIASVLPGAAGALAGALRPEDRLSIVAFKSDAVVLLDAAPPSSETAGQAFASVPYGGSSPTDLYGGLFAAKRLLEDARSRGFEGADRVVLLTSGANEAGVLDPDRVVALGESLVREGAALGVVGYGADYEAALPAELGSLGAGTYAYAEDGLDLINILTTEGETSLFPIALDFTLTLSPAPGYRVGRVYGVRRVHVEGGAATLELPALFVGARDGAKDVAGGRRGGGGGLFVELIADPGAGIGPGEAAFHVETRFTKPGTGAPNADFRSIQNALAPGRNPSDMWPSFSDETRGKAFMMLNMYLALRATVTLYAEGDCAGALGVSEMMAPSISGWQARAYDADIADDERILLLLRDNVAAACSRGGEPVTPIPPASFDGGCMML